jgi:DNA-binding response OmpR family regulator
MGKILVVEDDLVVHETLEHLFRSAGFQVEGVTDGKAALESFYASVPSAVVLDLQLPSMPGEDVCRAMKLRSPRVPTIILTAKSDVIDKVALLEMGAEDYITKPFSPREVLARVKGAIRRADAVPLPDNCSFSDVTVDFTRMHITRAGKPILLTPQEIKLLRYFCKNPDRVISRDELLNEVWGYESFPTTRTVDNHVLRLRNKLEKNPAEPIHFRTVHAFGYLFTQSTEVGV